MADKVHCYRNLREQCWSLKRGNSPVEHRDTLLLEGCTFVVQPGGRERVLRERRKCVHAFVRGAVAPPNTLPKSRGVAVTYNPYREPEAPGSFYRVSDGFPVKAADVVSLRADGKVVAWGIQSASGASP